MPNPLVSAITTLGTVLDTPRAMLWAALSGRNPLRAALNPSERLHGEDVTGEPLSGMALEILGDPLNLLGVAKIGQLANAARKEMGFYRLWRDREVAKVIARRAGKARVERFNRVRPLSFTRAEARTLAFGTPEQAAELIMRYKKVQPAKLPWLDRALERPGRVSVYEGGNPGVEGFVWSARPDVIFVRKRDRGLVAGTRAHEATHLLQLLDPERFRALDELFQKGPDYTEVAARYSQPSPLDIEQDLAKIPNRWRSPLRAEEHAAKVVGLAQKQHDWSIRADREIVPTLVHTVIESNNAVPLRVLEAEEKPYVRLLLEDDIERALANRGYPKEVTQQLTPELARLAMLQVPIWRPPPPPPKIPRLPPEMKNWRMRAPEKRIPSLAAALVGYNAPRIMRPFYYED